jgi:uncharacterized protein (TIGR03437 family)
LIRLRLLTLAAVLAAVFPAGRAFAVTVANLSIVSGNGQLICYPCTYNAYQSFEPLTVKATDASGNPVSGATISWSLASGQVTFNSTTVTAADGTSSNQPMVQTSSGSGSYIQATVLASAGSASALFTLSQALTQSGGVTLIQVTPPAYAGNPLYLSAPISGVSGTRAANPITVTVNTSVYGSGSGISGVSVRLVNDSASPTSTIACVTGAGADPGSVLTDSTGTANCTPVFGGPAGSGYYWVLVGGEPQSQSGSGPIGFAKFGTGGGAFQYTVTPAAPGMIQIVGGSGQSGNAGQTLSLPLVAKVADASGNGIPGQNVTFSVSPSTAATLANISSTSGETGQVSATLTLSSSASGTVLVTVAITGNSAISATFSETVNAPQIGVAGLQKNSGDQQSAVVSTAFAQPLVVTVNGSNGQPLSNSPVQFAVTAGSAALSASSVNTNSSGQAQVTVTAGATAGSVTVTATAGSYTQTFTLTVTPAGPTVTSSSFYNAAGFQQGSLSPCGLAAIIASGIAPGIQGIAGSQIVGPLPTKIALGTAGTVVSASFGGTLAPIYSASNINGQQQLTVQVPCEVTPGASVPVVVSVGAATANVSVAVLPASPGIFTSPGSDGVVRAVAVRPDGSFVSTTNPARKGETLVLYTTGMGATLPALGTDAVTPLGVSAQAQGRVIVGYGNASGGGGGVTAISATALPGTVGVFQVVFQVPSDAASGNNVNVSMGVIPVGSSTVYYSNTTKLPIQ